MNRLEPGKVDSLRLACSQLQGRPRSACKLPGVHAMVFHAKRRWVAACFDQTRCMCCWWWSSFVRAPKSCMNRLTAKQKRGGLTERDGRGPRVSCGSGLIGPRSGRSGRRLCKARRSRPALVRERAEGRPIDRPIVARAEAEDGLKAKRVVGRPCLAAGLSKAMVASASMDLAPRFRAQALCSFYPSAIQHVTVAL
jgi:hypothetical protein